MGSPATASAPTVPAGSGLLCVWISSPGPRSFASRRVVDRPGVVVARPVDDTRAGRRARAGRHGRTRSPRRRARSAGRAGPGRRAARAPGRACRARRTGRCRSSRTRTTRPRCSRGAGPASIDSAGVTRRTPRVIGAARPRGRPGAPFRRSPPGSVIADLDGACPRATTSTTGREPRIEWRPRRSPFSTDSSRNEGAVRSSGATKRRYASTGVSWSASRRTPIGIASVRPPRHRVNLPARRGVRTVSRSRFGIAAIVCRTACADAPPVSDRAPDHLRDRVP
jgi:hypothetical protein